MMAARRCGWAGIAAAASLIGVGAGLFIGGCVGAQAAGLSVSLTSVGVSLPSINVSVPSVGVSVPSVGVSLPGVSVSTPSVGVSTPSVSVSVPSAPSTGSTEAPVTGSPPTSPPGAGAPVSPSPPPSSTVHDDGRSDAAPASDFATALRSSPTRATTTTVRRTSADSAGRQSHPTAPRSARVHGHRRHRVGGGSNARTTAVGEVDRLPVRSSAPRAARTSRAAKHRTSNPLDTIGRHIPLPLPVPDWSKPIILGLLLLAIWFGVRSRVAVRRARRLEGQRATLLRDVGVMQAALVPEIPARVGGLAVSVAYRPAEGPAAGGDFYDVFVPARGKVAIVLGDVAGHGHRALAQAALTRYTLRAYLQAGLEPRAVLALAGRVLADPTLEHFATVAVGVYHVHEGRLTYACAGHPPPILHGLQTREPLAICASPPIGWTVPTGRRQTTVSLPPGAVACFFSDGLIEARCKNELLGRERVGELLASLGSRPDATRLLRRVRAVAPATPDDMAACIVVPEMTVVPVRTHIEELEADVQALDAGQVRRFLETCQVAGADIERTIARANDIVATFGTVLLRVQLAATTATVTAAVPSSGRQATSSGRWLQPVREPSGVH